MEQIRHKIVNDLLREIEGRINKLFLIVRETDSIYYNLLSMKKDLKYFGTNLNRRECSTCTNHALDSTTPVCSDCLSSDNRKNWIPNGGR